MASSLDACRPAAAKRHLGPFTTGEVVRLGGTDPIARDHPSIPDCRQSVPEVAHFPVLLGSRLTPLAADGRKDTITSDVITTSYSNRKKHDLRGNKRSHCESGPSTDQVDADGR